MTKPHQRFALRWNSGDPRMYRCYDGDIIRREDHQAEVDALKARVAKMGALVGLPNPLRNGEPG